MAAPKTDSSGQVVQPRLITHLGDGAIPLTNRDIALDLQVLTDLKKGPQNADGMTPETANVLKALAALQAFNGTSLDRWRNMEERTLLASAARTATTSSPEQTNYNARGVIVDLNVTVNPGGAETLQIYIQQRDPVANLANLYIANANAFGGTAGRWIVVLYPAAIAVVQSISAAQNTILPRSWRISVLHSAAGSWTYSVSSTLLL